MASRPRRKGGLALGRRPGNTATRADILDAAEEEFAARGYVGTSLRDITQRAKLNTALVKYYFGSKEGLYKAIFLRRGNVLVEERLRAFDELERRAAPPTVEEIVHAFLIPFFKFDSSDAGGMAFIKLQARLHNEPAELTQSLRTQVYETSIQRCIASLRRALPNVEPNAIYWRMVFLIGAYIHAISDVNRLQIISHGACDPKDRNEALRQLVAFIVGGLTADPPGGRVETTSKNVPI